MNTESNIILDLKAELNDLKTKSAVIENRINTIEREIISMTSNIEKNHIEANNNFDKIQSSFNKLIWFGFSTSLGMLTTLAVSVVLIFIK
jgi:hypothetical protein